MKELGTSVSRDVFLSQLFGVLCMQFPRTQICKCDNVYHESPGSVYKYETHHEVPGVGETQPCWTVSLGDVFRCQWSGSAIQGCILTHPETDPAPKIMSVYSLRVKRSQASSLLEELQLGYIQRILWDQTMLGTPLGGMCGKGSSDISLTSQHIT